MKKKPRDEKKFLKEDRVWNLYVRGRTQRTISKELKMSLSSVNNYIKAAHERYKKMLDEDIKRYHEKHLSQLEHIAEEALRSWQKDLKIGKYGKQHDAAYLETAMRSIEQIRKIIHGRKQEQFEESDEAKDPAFRILEIVRGVKERMKNEP